MILISKSALHIQSIVLRSSFRLPLFVKSPAWIRTSPAGILKPVSEGVYPCVSETQTKRVFCRMTRVKREPLSRVGLISVRWNGRRIGRVGRQAQCEVSLALVISARRKFFWGKEKQCLRGSRSAVDGFMDILVIGPNVST